MRGTEGQIFLILVLVGLGPRSKCYCLSRDLESIYILTLDSDT